MSASLRGRVALVTGGSRGIGRATVCALAAAGAQVAFCHHGDEEQARRTEALVREAGGQAEGFEADVRDEVAVRQLFESVLQRYGRLDICVNNAGILREAPLVSTTLADFEAVLAVNLRGTFLVGREAARHMAAHTDAAHPGRIVNMASDLALLGRSGMSAYSASKGAVASLTRVWATELAPNVLVNAVAPGPVDTDMLGADVMSPEALAADLDTPLARFADPAEVAALVTFLAGDGARFITGQCLGINGGSVMP